MACSPFTHTIQTFFGLNALSLIPAMHLLLLVTHSSYESSLKPTFHMWLIVDRTTAMVSTPSCLQQRFKQNRLNGRSVEQSTFLFNRNKMKQNDNIILSHTLYVGETKEMLALKSARHEAIWSTYDMSHMLHIYTHVVTEYLLYLYH